MITKILHGNDALGYVVALHDTVRRGIVTMQEFACGIDIDCGARYYEHSYTSDYESLLWTCMNYLSGTKSTVAEYFSAAIDDDRLIEFYINTGLDDTESRGIRYEFTYL